MIATPGRHPSGVMYRQRSGVRSTCEGVGEPTEPVTCQACGCAGCVSTTATAAVAWSLAADGSGANTDCLPPLTGNMTLNQCPDEGALQCNWWGALDADETDCEQPNSIVIVRLFCEVTSVADCDDFDEAGSQQLTWRIEVTAYNNIRRFGAGEPPTLDPVTIPADIKTDPCVARNFYLTLENDSDIVTDSACRVLMQLVSGSDHAGVVTSCGGSTTGLCRGGGACEQDLCGDQFYEFDSCGTPCPQSNCGVGSTASVAIVGNQCCVDTGERWPDDEGITSCAVGTGDCDDMVTRALNVCEEEPA